MRINKWIAVNAPYSRRGADRLIEEGRVTVNGIKAITGQEVTDADAISIDGKSVIVRSIKTTVLLLNKPVGYVCSRDGQGAPTIYKLIPTKFHHLDIAGRLDKDSSGLVLITNDGELLHQLTHPSFAKEKRYEVRLNKPLSPKDAQRIAEGVRIDDYTSKLNILQLSSEGLNWQVLMHEGRNRQIRRTFEMLGYKVEGLNRTNIGSYSIKDIQTSQYLQVL